jgi:RNA polymerase sigma-70 factor (ECF subfamily)
VFFNLLRCGKTFENTQHERAWLIVTASNVCKNMLKKKSRKALPLEDEHIASEDIVDETFAAILALPQKYKLAIYLYYYEGYSAKEIGNMLGKRQSTIWKHLKTGRDMLREQLAEEI